MNGVEFKDQNCIFCKPKTMGEDECLSLPTKKTTNGQYPSIESVWELSDEELALVLKSKRIRLGVLGNGMPPVYMIAEPETVAENA